MEVSSVVSVPFTLSLYPFLRAAFLVLQKPSHGVFQHKNESTILRKSDFTTRATHSFHAHTPSSLSSVRRYYTTPGQRQFTSAATSRITATVNTQKCNKTHSRENNETRCSRGRISAQHKRAFQCSQNGLKADNSTMFTHRGSTCRCQLHTNMKAVI